MEFYDKMRIRTWTNTGDSNEKMVTKGVTQGDPLSCLLFVLGPANIILWDLKELRLNAHEPIMCFVDDFKILIINKNE